VWWLVAPQNPLKPAAGMAPFAARFAGAKMVAAADRRIRVSDIETRLGTAYTADTIAALRRKFPGRRFVWLMGGDNLAQFPYWRRWQDIFRSVPIAVFDRPAASLKALSGKAAQRFGRARVKPEAARRLAEMRPPAWVFFHTPLDPRSATQIRNGRAVLDQQEKRPDVISQVTTMTPRQPRPAAELDPGLLPRILASLDDGKAEDIVTIDLAGKTTIADYMVIASGRSARQVAALTDHLEEALSPRRVAVEGKAQCDWVLVDAGDVIIHIFRPEIRAYYNLEKMWGDALPDLEAVQQ
jgi:ribosome silencing factor RsfS/YbeB/iojap/nicotinate (nicotinamide) nucleotide adenylyltransferase